MNIVHSDGFGKSIRVWFYTYLRGNTSMDVRDDLFFNLHSCKWKEKKSLVDLRKIPKYHVLQDGDKVQIIDYHDT